MFDIIALFQSFHTTGCVGSKYHHKYSVTFYSCLLSLMSGGDCTVCMVLVEHLAGLVSQCYEFLMLQIKTGAQQESIFNAVCEYKLICDIPFPDCEPYPFVSDTNWGPGRF